MAFIIGEGDSHSSHGSWRETYEGYHGRKHRWLVPDAGHDCSDFVGQGMAAGCRVSARALIGFVGHENPANVLTMSEPTADATMAFLDLENIALGAKDARFPPFDIQLVLSACFRGRPSW